MVEPEHRWPVRGPPPRHALWSEQQGPAPVPVVGASLWTAEDEELRVEVVTAAFLSHRSGRSPPVYDAAHEFVVSLHRRPRSWLRLSDPFARAMEGNRPVGLWL